MKDGVKCVSEKEVPHFGIPTARTVEQKRRTKVQPFSFEERDRQRLKKKEETIQKVSHTNTTNLDIGELPRITHTTFRTWRKFEIKNKPY